MELFTAAEDLKFFDAFQIIGEAVKIPAKSSPLKYFLITITLILPFSLIQLLFKISFTQFFFTLYDYFSGDSSATYLIHEFFYILSLFLLSLLSISAIVFTVASIYVSKSISFIPTLFAVPRIFKHLMITFFYALLLMIVNFLAALTFIYVLVDLLHIDEGVLFWGLFIMFCIIYFLVSLYVTALWHLASVISVVEPNVYGLAAMKKSKELLQGRTAIAVLLVNFYLSGTWFVEKAFVYGMQFPVHVMAKLFLGLMCLFMLVAVNLTGLLVQSVFYFACKAYHNQVVDKKVLYDHLCGYDLGDMSVALNPPSAGGVAMQSFVKDHDGVGYQPVALTDTTESDGTV
ncbi:hypothetical protein C5167_036158 [Papaver somniferum]|uniref:uncharacterized protein LOC113331386 n=1 Tax=Papaver somniferum TaxID=3469 RepID=UPI000E70546E|nr:uncharacterized protein LOC113331386 [Papaver somniferum]RZC87616.1 hypothetical protein C5167_036158 [Papaver somniferum]